MVWWYTREQEKKAQSASVSLGVKKAIDKKKDSSKPKTDNSSQLKQKEISSVEDEIEVMESELKKIETLLAQPDIYENDKKPAETNSNYQTRKVKLDTLNEKWEKLVEELG